MNDLKKGKLLSLIADGKIQEALSFLRNKMEGTKYNTEIISIISRYSNLQRLSSKNIISPEAYQIEYNILIESLLKLIDKINFGHQSEISPPPLDSIDLCLSDFLIDKINELYIFLHETILTILHRKKIIEKGKILLPYMAILNSSIIKDVLFIRTKEVADILIYIDVQFESFSQKDIFKVISYLKVELNLKGDIKVNKVEKGSVIMQLEMSSEDAENLYLAIKLKKIKGLKIKDVKLIGFEQIDQINEVELDKIQSKIKDELSVQIDKGLSSLEKVLHKKSERYEDFLLIKNNHIKIERMNNQKLIDFDTYMVQSNRILNSLIKMVGQLTSTDIFRMGKA